MLAELTAGLDLTATPSISTLKRISKRVRKSLRSKRDPDLFEQSRQQLATLIEQSKQKEIDLFLAFRIFRAFRGLYCVVESL